MGFLGYLSLYVRMQHANLRSRLMYPFNFFFGIFAVTGSGAFSIAFLYVLTRKIPVLAGWSFYEVVFIASMSMISYSVSFIFFIQLQEIDYYIRFAEFDRILVRPLNPLFQFICKRINVNSVGPTAFATGTLIYSGYHLRDWDLLSILLTVLLLFCGTVVCTSILLLIASVAFRFLQSGGLFELREAIYDNVSDFPITFFPKWFQAFLTFVLPQGFMGFYPAVYLIGRSDQSMFGNSVLLACLVATVCFALLSYYAWSRAIRSYAGAGS
ncbi:ABC-2 family transporter protein [Brevibacillus humidisoli]|uniref:ABC transporter permease n=1 Tax=Brevibacillus humidisoli TaxID=2895522 RepID=UPI001E53A75A|nr:ABC-2 family transporter protein [Brevibacillus humidisoli]UFJ42476.1 ABC-2 family transporter protein [Brevibacillus humidisoli]